MNKILELAVKPVLLLKLEAKELKVEFPLSAVVAAEQAIGRDLKSIADWFQVKWQEVAGILHAGLAKHHPETAIDEIKAFCEELGAEGVLEIRHALMCLNFPRAMAKLEEHITKGKTSPNAPGAGAQ